MECTGPLRSIYTSNIASIGRMHGDLTLLTEPKPLGLMLPLWRALNAIGKAPPHATHVRVECVEPLKKSSLSYLALYSGCMVG